MHPAELAELFARLSENTQNVSIQIEFVDAAGVRIGSVKHLFRPGSDADGPRRAHLGPLFEKVSVVIKNLDAVILAVADVHVSLGIGGDSMDGVKLSGS